MTGFVIVVLVICEYLKLLSRRSDLGVVMWCGGVVVVVWWWWWWCVCVCVCVRACVRACKSAMR